MNRGNYNSGQNTSSSTGKLPQAKRRLILRDSSSPENCNTEAAGTFATSYSDAPGIVQKALQGMQNAIGRLTEEVFCMRQEIKKNRIREEAAMSSTFIIEEPLSDEEELHNLEEKLKEEQNFHAMINNLLTLSAKTPQAYIRKAFRSVFSDSLAQNVTWLGTKNKKAAKNLVVVAAIQSSFKRKYAEQAFSSVEEVGKKYFHYAHDRMSKKNKAKLR